MCLNLRDRSESQTIACKPDSPLLSLLINASGGDSLVQPEGYLARNNVLGFFFPLKICKTATFLKGQKDREDWQFGLREGGKKTGRKCI